MNGNAQAHLACFVKQLGRYPAEDSVNITTNGLPVVSKSCKAVAPPSTQILKMKDIKGGNPAEWPPGLLVREFPHTAPPVTVTEAGDDLGITPDGDDPTKDPR